MIDISCTPGWIKTIGRQVWYVWEYPLGWVLPYLDMVERFRGDDPILGIFNEIGSLFYTSTQSDWLPSFCRKNRVISITFTSRDTRTLLQFSTQIYYLTYFNILLNFRSNSLHFSLILSLFDPHFHKTLNLIGSKKIRVVNPATKKLMNTPPPLITKDGNYMTQIDVQCIAVM